MTNEETPSSLREAAVKRQREREEKAKNQLKQANSLKERVEALEEYLGVNEG